MSIRMGSGQEIRLTNDGDGGWTAVDVEIGVDPETVPDEPQVPDAPWFDS